MNTSDPIEWAIRIIESIAFTLHGFLGITEPFTGCLRRAFGDRGAMPSWFWPVAGMILFLVAYLNFSPFNWVILMTQAYIMAFHTGAVLYHRKLGHHPAAGLAPGVFVFFAFGVVWIRMNFVLAFVMALVCAFIAAGLAEVLVHPREDAQESLLQNEDDEASPEERANQYLPVED